MMGFGSGSEGAGQQMPSASVLGCEGVGRGRSQGSGRSVSVQGCVVGGQVAAGRARSLARSLALQRGSAD